MTTVLYDSIVSRVATVVPMFAKAIVDSALEGAGLTASDVTPVQMLRLLRDEIEPRIRKFSRVDGGLVSIGAAVVSTDEQGRVVRLDPMARVLLDLPRCVQPEDQLVSSRLAEIGLDPGAPSAAALVRETRLGQSGRVVNVAWAPRLDRRGNPAGRTAVVQDVTLRVAMEEAVLRYEADLKRAREEIETRNRDLVAQHAALDETNRKLAEAGRHKSEFLSRMSHEMRTPLHCMIGYTQLAQKEIDAGHIDAASQYLRTAMESAQDLLCIINDVLDFSKADGGSVGLRIEEVDLAAVVMECVEVARPLVSGRDLALEARAPGHGVVIGTDRLRLKQILINLIGNAVKFTVRGRIAVELDEPSGGEVRIRVVDSGIGIPASEMERIFEEFYQVDESTTRTYQGTGLGLALVRHFTQILGGRVEVESTMGQGSTFTVVLPVGRAAAVRS